MPVNGEGVVGVAGSRDQAESVAATTGDGDDSQRGNGTSHIAALAIDESRIGGGNESSRGGRDVVPVREGDNCVLVVNIVSGAREEMRETRAGRFS